jgi:hypothetical protein
MNPSVQAHAEYLVKKIREALDRFPDTPVIECCYIGCDSFHQQIETLTLDIGGERGNPDRLEITFRYPHGEGQVSE